MYPFLFQENRNINRRSEKTRPATYVASNPILVHLKHVRMSFSLCLHSHSIHTYIHIPLFVYADFFSKQSFHDWTLNVQQCCMDAFNECLCVQWLKCKNGFHHTKMDGKFSFLCNCNQKSSVWFAKNEIYKMGPNVSLNCPFVQRLA